MLSKGAADVFEAIFPAFRVTFLYFPGPIDLPGILSPHPLEA